MLITQNKVKAQYVNDLFFNELEEEILVLVHKVSSVPGCTLICMHKIDTIIPFLNNQPH